LFHRLKIEKRKKNPERKKEIILSETNEGGTTINRGNQF
jgi:hypothetical protein